MKPIDFRDAHFESLQERLVGRRKAVYWAWLTHGPGTTRQVAERSGIDILSFRPRSTELYQMGGIRLEDGQENGNRTEGIYRARDVIEWAGWVEDRRASLSGQLQML